MSRLLALFLYIKTLQLGSAGYHDNSNNYESIK